MVCGKCGLSGHNRLTCGRMVEKCIDGIKRLIKPRIPKLDKRNTEELGKVTEMAVCSVFTTAFVGAFDYETKQVEKLKLRFAKVPDLFQYKTVKHTGVKNGRYDITGTNDDGTVRYLSIKSSKSQKGKVCPQVIGQPCHNVFCDYFKLPRTSKQHDIKIFIIDNVTTLLTEYFNHTFDCDIFYYNEYQDKCIYVKPVKPVEWEKLQFAFTRGIAEWKESSTLHVVNGTDKPVTIGEFQVHNNRDGIKFRWNFENVLQLFSDSFDIKEL